MHNEPEPFFTVNQLAKAWGIKGKVVRRFITSPTENPRLRAINVGMGSRNYWRIPQSAVDEFVMAKSQVNKGEPSTLQNGRARR